MAPSFSSSPAFLQRPAFSWDFSPALGKESLRSSFSLAEGVFLLRFAPACPPCHLLHFANHAGGRPVSCGQEAGVPLAL